MQIVYIGKKKALHMRLKWLKEPFMIGRHTEKKPMPTEVDDDDALKLISEFPETFAEYKPDPLAEFIAANGIEDDDSDDGTEFDLDSVEFDVEGDSYICPVCGKKYKMNSGRGKAMLVNHLKERHAKEWADFLSKPDEAAE